MKKKLPLAPPPILLYVDYSYTLSIIRNYSNTDAWFYSNYIQLFYQKIETSPDETYKFFITDFQGRIWHPYLPWFHYQAIQRSLVKSLNINIINMIISSLNENYYVNLYWDEFYVPNGITYKKDHYCHATLIYGYDLNEKCFYSVGFKNTRNYEYFKISFYDFEQAYNSDATDLTNQYNTTEICLMKFNDKFSFDFNISTLIQQMNDFYLSRNSLLNYGTHFNNNYMNTDYFGSVPTSSFTFGIDTYKNLQLYIETIPSVGQKSFQPIHALWEHKKIMLDRIEYLQNNKYLSRGNSFNISYKEIEVKSKILRNLFIKFQISKHDKLIPIMVSILTEIYEQEIIVLPLMIKELCSRAEEL